MDSPQQPPRRAGSPGRGGMLKSSCRLLTDGVDIRLIELMVRHSDHD
jgi:hypothetical protein